MIQPIIPINWIILTLSYQYARRVICLRQAGTWDPLLQCLYLDKHLLRQQNTKKTIRDESNSMNAQLGQIMNKKTKKSNCHFGGVQIKKAGEHSWCLYMAPPKGWGGRPPTSPLCSYLPICPYCFCPVAKSYPPLCNLRGRSTPDPLASTIAQSLLKFMSIESVLLSN